MADLVNIKKKITDMSKLALKMWRMTNRTFMEHDVDLIAGILEDENKLNDLEKEITSELIEFARTSQDSRDKARALVYAEIVEDLELIGDYCKDILERVQIKIEERLLFSDDAVKEYNELYQITETALDEITCVLQKDNVSLVNAALVKNGHLDKLVDEYRARHNQRLIKGVCSPIACNMFLNMLDFTAAVYYHVKKIARNLVKIKNE